MLVHQYGLATKFSMFALPPLVLKSRLTYVATVVACQSSSCNSTELAAAVQFGVTQCAANGTVGLIILPSLLDRSECEASQERN